MRRKRTNEEKTQVVLKMIQLSTSAFDQLTTFFERLALSSGERRTHSSAEKVVLDEKRWIRQLSKSRVQSLGVVYTGDRPTFLSALRSKVLHFQNYASFFVT